MPKGVILDRDLSKIHEVDLNAEDQIQEYVAHSWYKYKDGKDKGLHPYNGETEFDYTGPQPPYQHLDTDASYSWLKSALARQGGRGGSAGTGADDVRKR